MVKSLASFNFKKHLKGNYSLIPLVAVGIFGLSIMAASSLRHFIKNPDVIINRKNNKKLLETSIDEGK
jgi:hypothetical protein